MTYHNPVLLQSACDFLEVTPGKLYIDATVGGGEHASEIVRRGGRVLGMDQDPDAILEASKIPGLRLVKSNFIYLKEVVTNHHWRPVSGILADLGVSEHQVQEPNRGFSYQKSGPLDMRMGATEVTAADIVNLWPVEQLASLLATYGEIPVAKVIAQKIVAARPLLTTQDLSQIAGKWSQQTFQALRIAVNDELGALNLMLPQALEVLAPGGRLVIISFHSLEDRIVKNTFHDWKTRGFGEVLTRKPIVGERKSKLRAFKKL